MNIAPNLMTHRARGCPFIANVDGEDFVIDGLRNTKGTATSVKQFILLVLLFFKTRKTKKMGT